ncbi:MAG TPA: dihydrodipicolinate synthase family protein [Gaiellaceae bacterium]|jgi:dihydrodipicolinate synthase/N-acetylneuraminate lyase
MLRGAIAAALTPLRDGGATLDEEAIGPYVEFLADGGVDGVLALGTTGEGILLTLDERRHAAELFLQAGSGRLAVAIHCGAQTTADTVALAEHAAGSGADAVAVIGPPYFELDGHALLAHFEAAAAACAPTPFYVYEFAARSGYSVPVPVLAELRERASNLAGLKVSDAPWERFEPYLLDGFDVFVGPEALIPQGLARGAAGAVSGLASVYPELVVEAVRTGEADLGPVRAALQRFPFHAAAKLVLGRRGVPVGPAVRAPLRTLTPAEEDELTTWLDSAAPATAL